MRIKLKNSPEQVELIKAMGSKDRATSWAAMEAFAAAMGPVIGKVLNQVGTASMIYEDQPFNQDEDFSYPLDLYYGARVDTVKVWSQNMAGGLATSHVSGMQELKVATYQLNSAVELLKKYARKCRLPAVAMALNRMAQEILNKQNMNAWIVLMKALGEASTNGTSHVISATTPNVFQLDDLNRLITLVSRLNASWTGGTSDESIAGLTDLIVSPEIMEQVRGMAYQPQNTRQGAITATANGTSATAVPLTDSVRDRIFQSAGNSELFGVSLTPLLELGDGKVYNALFKRFYGGSFTAASDQVVVGLNLAGESAFIRPIEADADTGATAVVSPDDQYNVARAEKIGFYTGLSEGRIVIDSRKIVAITV